MSNRDGIIKPPIDELLTTVDSKYQLVFLLPSVRVRSTITTPTSAMAVSTTTWDLSFPPPLKRSRSASP